MILYEVILFMIKFTIASFFLTLLISHIIAIEDTNDDILLNKFVQIILNNDKKLFRPLDKRTRRQESSNGEGIDIIENELKNALAHKKSVLFDKTYIEKQGKNDFLVVEPDMRDPFVTIIPNALYYNIEKKCVNWLDDCNLQGIRHKFFRNIHSSYQK